MKTVTLKIPDNTRLLHCFMLIGNYGDEFGTSYSVIPTSGMTISRSAECDGTYEVVENADTPVYEGTKEGIMQFCDDHRKNGCDSCPAFMVETGVCCMSEPYMWRDVNAK